MATYLVTGTSRGIGLEIVRQLLAAPATKVQTVVAVTRNSNSTTLNELVNASQGRAVNVVVEDITDEKSIKASLPAIEKALGGPSLDILVNNAGASDWFADGIASMPASALVETFRTNVASVQAVTSTLMPLLQSGKSKKIINITTTLGSIALAENYSFAPTHGYKTSKAALNMLTKLWAMQYKESGFTIVAISPGWLKTDLGSDSADLPVSDGVKSVLEITDRVSVDDTGKFLTVKVPGWETRNGQPYYDGSEQPW